MRRIPYTLFGLLVAAALIAVLAWQNHQLRDQQHWLAERVSHPYQGMYVPKIPIATVHGEALTLGDGRGDVQVLYFFSPTCTYCLASVPAVKSLAHRVSRQTAGRVRLLGIGSATDAVLRAYAQTHGFAFPVAAITDRRTLMLYRARTVPLVLVIDRDGRVRHSHLGTLHTVEDVEAVLAAMRTAPAPTTLATAGRIH